jgi:DNA-directed RNA polymerase subunit RPC12/RpoP
MANVNVTLADDSAIPPYRRFPCPSCGVHLELRESRSKKPYCVCNTCGVQVFFRGKVGISRLSKLLDEHERLIGSPITVAAPAIAAFDRLEQLRAHKNELERRRPLIFSDNDLEHTILAVDREIARLQLVLEQMSSAD